MQTARHIYPDLALGWPRFAPKKRQLTTARRFNFSNFVLLWAMMGLMAFVHVYQQALVAQNGIDIARLKSDIKEESRVGKNLRIEKMLLQSPSRLERLAVAKLGMIKPNNINYIVMPVSKPFERSVKAAKKGPSLSNVLVKASVSVR